MWTAEVKMQKMIDKVDLKQYQATRGGNIYCKTSCWVPGKNSRLELGLKRHVQQDRPRKKKHYTNGMHVFRSGSRTRVNRTGENNIDKILLVC